MLAHSIVRNEIVVDLTLPTPPKPIRKNENVSNKIRTFPAIVQLLKSTFKNIHSDENVLKLDCGNGCTNFNFLKIVELHLK